MIRAIRILGYPKRGYLRSFGGREAFMHRRRVLILTVALAFVCGANWQVLAQRNNNDKGKQQQQRPPQEQQDVQALVTLVDTALLADTGVPIPAPGACNARLDGHVVSAFPSARPVQEAAHNRRYGVPRVPRS